MLWRVNNRTLACCPNIIANFLQPSPFFRRSAQWNGEFIVRCLLVAPALSLIFSASGSSFPSIGLMLSSLFNSALVVQRNAMVGSCSVKNTGVLSCFVRDILSIMGVFLLPPSRYYSDVLKDSAATGECIFSGAHDTISLRCANLKPQTIHALMLFKRHLRLS